MLRVKQLPTFDCVAAGRKAVCDLTLGLRYHVIWLVLGNNAVAANGIADLVDDITVKIKGKPQRQMTAVQLNDLNGSARRSTWSSRTALTVVKSRHSSRCNSSLATRTAAASCAGAFKFWTVDVRLLATMPWLSFGCWHRNLHLLHNEQNCASSMP